MEAADYGDTDFRYELEGDNRPDYNENYGKYGYQTGQFDSESGELIADEDDFADLDDEFVDDFADGSDSLNEE